MICPRCGERSATEETRGERRRRVCRLGHSFHTVEVIEQHWLRLSRVDLARRTLREKGYLQ